MAELKGTVIASRIVPSDSLDTYATHDADYGRGGYRSVADLAERDSIPEPRRKVGMKVFVNDVGIEYQLVGGITNTNWQVASSTGGSDICGITNELTFIRDDDYLVLCRDGLNFKVKASALKEYFSFVGDAITHEDVSIIYNGQQIIHN